MKRILSAAMLCFALATVASANLLDDPSFELATDNSNTSNSQWELINPNDSASFSESVWAASDGTKGVWFKSFVGTDATPADATLTQTVSNVAQSGAYRLTFDSARETHFRAAGATATLSSSGGQSVSIDLLTAAYLHGGNMETRPAPNEPPLSGPTHFSLLLPGVNAGESLTVTIEMSDGVLAPDNPQSLMVDNFDLSFVPEPGSSALVGLVVLALLARRK